MIEIEEKIWDAVVVGAGPAGSVSACLLARRGWRVLLLEKSKWPREKVCGGCVNARAVGMLREMGLGEVLRGGERLDRYSLHVGGRGLEMRLPEGVAVSREMLDERLVAAAEREGVCFVAGAGARLVGANSKSDYRHLRVMIDGKDMLVRSRVVLACDGIGGTVLQEEGWAGWRVARDAWFGVSALVDGDLVERGVIGMHVGRGGYAGAARLADGRVHVAAALDPVVCREAGGPAEVVGRLLGRDFSSVRFQGTGLLTRRRENLGGHRVLAVGDACGYVEPFTGEGIAWAVRGAREVVGILPGDAGAWEGAIVKAWEKSHAGAVRTHWCRALRRLVRWPGVLSAGMVVGNILPGVARGIGGRVSGVSCVKGVGT